VTSWVSALVGLTPVLALPCLDGPAKEEKRVKVTVVVILARDSGNEVDKQLKNIAEEVRKLHPDLNLRSFKIKHWEVKSLAPDEKAVFKLVDNKTATIVVKHGADEQNRVGLAVAAPGQEEIVYRSACGKFLPIITRCQTKANERLILAICVKPCNGGK